MAAEIKSQGEICTFCSGKKKSDRSKCFVLVGGYTVVTVSIEEAKFQLHLSVTCAACIGTFEAGKFYF